MRTVVKIELEYDNMVDARHALEALLTVLDEEAVSASAGIPLPLVMSAGLEGGHPDD